MDDNDLRKIVASVVQSTLTEYSLAQSSGLVEGSLANNLQQSTAYGQTNFRDYNEGQFGRSQAASTLNPLAFDQSVIGSHGAGFQPNSNIHNSGYVPPPPSIPSLRVQNYGQVSFFFFSKEF